jgi:hypothetical protein
VARILIVGGGCRGRRLGEAMVGEGHALRITTRTGAGRAAIEAAGAQCWIGTPDRLATLRGALDGVAILCWLMGSASGPPEQLRALHSERLRFFLTQAIDTTVRGFLYEARAPAGGAAAADGASSAEMLAGGEAGAQGATGAEMLAEGERIVREMTARNAIPAAILTADPSDVEAWLAQAAGAIARLLVGG